MAKKRASRLRLLVLAAASGGATGFAGACAGSHVVEDQRFPIPATDAGNLADVPPRCACPCADGDASGACCDSIDDGAVPVPSDAGLGDGGVSVLVVRHLWFGDVDPSGASTPDGWRSVGFNLDGESCNQRAHHCIGSRAAHAYDQGYDGIDNAFGRSIVDGLLVGVSDGPTLDTDRAVAAGEAHVLVLDPASASAAWLVARSDAVDAGTWAPVSDDSIASGESLWHPDQASVDATGAPLVRLAASLDGDTFVARGDALRIQVPIGGGYLFPLVVHRPVLGATLDAGALRGTLGGLVFPDEVRAPLKALLVSVAGTAACGSSSGVEQQVEDASDILDDGTQDPTLRCNAISFGVAFEAVPAKLAAPAPIPAPSAAACPP